MSSDPERHEALRDICATHDNDMREAIIVLRDRLDAALKRIEELEKLVTAWRGTQKYEPTPEEDARRQRAIEHIDAVNERIAAQKAAKP